MRDRNMNCAVISGLNTEKLDLFNYNSSHDNDVSFSIQLYVVSGSHRNALVAVFLLLCSSCLEQKRQGRNHVPRDLHGSRSQADKPSFSLPCDDDVGQSCQLTLGN